MCGIAGGVGSFTPERLAEAASSLAHRGPDDHGFLGWDGTAAPARVGRGPEVGRGARVALAHRRLSILDLTEGGWQPMGTPDGRLWIVFNGEIYNFRELRVELERAGRIFRSRSDTEVLLAAWDTWGPDCLSRLVGMFAFALLDRAAGTLTLVRDFFGIKPLYWTRTAEGLAFASEIPALLRLAAPSRAADPQRVYDYLRFGLTDHGDGTLLRAVRQLPPAHLLSVPLNRPGRDEPVAYWRLPSSGPVEIGRAEAATRLRTLFLRNVELHLRSDVPVGAALSGGIDSSSIVMGMRHVAGSALDLHAFSYVADDPAVSEESWIRLVGEAAGARVHATSPSPADLVTDLERLIDVQGEPFGSTSIYAQHRVFGLAARAGVKVMLDGQGADELLAGYRPYLAARMLSLLRGPHPWRAWSFWRRASRLPGNPGRDALYGLGAHLVPPALHAAVRRAAGRDLYPGWLEPRWFLERGVGTALPQAPLGRHALHDQLRRTVAETSLPGLLRYEDRNSMAHSIESRVPFLTPELASFVLTLPEDLLIDREGVSKAVFRDALRGIVPDAVLDRRDKIGFATPERAWLSAIPDWVGGILGSDAARAIPPLVLPAARAEADALLAGSRPFGWQLWRILNLIRWTERFSVDYAA